MSLPVAVGSGGVELLGDLEVPPNVTGLVVFAHDRMREHDAVRDLPVGLFGASTGAAAALIAAAGDQEVRAVVSRGGRPDLAGDALHDVQAPTLMIVGGRDPRILEANLQASRELAAAH